MPAGTAILADWQQAGLLIRQAASTLASTQSKIGEVDLWATNQVCLRAEGRFGLKILRPQAFALVELVEGS